MAKEWQFHYPTSEPWRWYDYDGNRTFRPIPGVYMEWREKPSPPVTIELDAEAAGYLVDLLHRHVGGRLTLSDEPLGRARRALTDAGVERLRAFNRNGSDHYAALYRSESEVYPTSDDDLY